MLLGFALTRHCNLRCPHCIRDDVASVMSLPADLVVQTADDATALFGSVSASFTGGEPTLHPQWERIVSALADRGITYSFATNAWHLRRLMPVLDRYRPRAVRLSLSGGTAEVHDAERGRDSFRRVLLGVALLTSRGIPATLSMVIDRRDRHQIRLAADLAESLGVTGIHFILPQPVPASGARDSDLPPHEWLPVKREIDTIAREASRRSAVRLDFGAPAEPGEPEITCDTMALRRLYVDVDGRVSLCCQLSEYGFNDADVVGDLSAEPLAKIYDRYARRLETLRWDGQQATRGTPLAEFPCLRCAKALGKLDWLRSIPDSPWSAASHGAELLETASVA